MPSAFAEGIFLSVFSYRFMKGRDKMSTNSKIIKTVGFIIKTALASVLICGIFVYAYKFPVTMKLLDNNLNKFAAYAGIEAKTNFFSSFSEFSHKTVDFVLYWYETAKNNLEDSFEGEKISSSFVFSCAADFPLENKSITSEFGERKDPFSGELINHNGIDVAAAYGSPVTAAWPGKVFEVGYDDVYGNYVVIEHSKGFFTKYCHLSKVLCEEGKFASSGEKIGEVGSTGRSTGNHLHFEVEVGGTKIDPKECFEA